MTPSEKQHEIDRQRIAALEAELDAALVRIEQLEQMHFNVEWMAPDEIGLTTSENRVVGVLVGHEGVVTLERFMQALYSLRPDDPPEEKIIDVFICKARRKLRPFGVEIETRWGVGYLMPAESRAILQNWGREAA